MSSNFSFDPIYTELILKLTFHSSPLSFFLLKNNTCTLLSLFYIDIYIGAVSDTYIFRNENKKKESHLLHLRNTEDKRNIKVFMFFFRGSNRKDMRLQRKSKIKFLKSLNEIFSVTHYEKRQSKFWGYLRIAKIFFIVTKFEWNCAFSRKE